MATLLILVLSSKSFASSVLGEQADVPVEAIRSQLLRVFVVSDQNEPQFETMNLNKIESDANLIDAIGSQNKLHSLYLPGARITNKGIDEVAKKTSIQLLSLSMSNIGDDGLRSLGRLKDLRTLDISFAEKLSDKGFESLGELAKLESLDLRNTRIGNGGMNAVGGLKTLRTLSLQGAKHIGSEGFKAIAGLSNLKELNLRGTKISDEDLKALAGLKKLKRLDLGFTVVGDRGMKELSSVSNLEWLDLGWTKVTDAGLIELTQLKQLRFLGLRNNKMISNQGVLEIKKSIPDLEIRFGVGPK